MRRKSQSAAIVILTVLCLWAAWLLSTRREPAYGGRSLKGWLSLCHARPYAIPLEAMAAVQAMGTNTVPWLRADLRARDTRLKLRAIDFIAKHKVFRIAHTPASTRCVVAAKLCAALGPGARAATPELAEVLRVGDPATQLAAVDALTGLGPPALHSLTNPLPSLSPMIRLAVMQALPKLGTNSYPALTNALADSSPAVRISAAVGLRNAGPEALIDCLADPVPIVRQNAASTLGRMGAKGKVAEPALAKALNDSGFQVRLRAAEALSALDPAWNSEPRGRIVAEAVNFLLNPANTVDARMTVAMQLSALDRDAQKKMPFLMSALMSGNQRLLSAGVQALYATNWPARARVQPLVTLLASPDDYNLRAAAADALGQLGPAAAAASTALGRCLRDEWLYVRASAARAVGLIGADPTAVAPLLQEALHDESPQVQLEAAAALWRLDGNGAPLRAVLPVALGHKLARVRLRAAELQALLARAEPAAPLPAGDER